MILIFSNHDDMHTKVITEKLKKQGISFFVVDISNMTKYMYVETNYSAPATKFDIFDGNNHIDLNNIRSIWWRRPQIPSVNPEITNSQYINFAYNEWNTILSGLWQCNREKLWINDIVYDQLSSNKVYQLEVAKKIGLQLPKTLITNNQYSVVSFWKENQGKIIFKPFHSSPSYWRETRPLIIEFFRYMNTLKYVPCIFQEYIDNSYDVRITVVGESVLAAITKPHNYYEFDWRMTQPRFKKYLLPDNIKKLVIKYMRELKLEFGAIDMKLTEDDQYYFLEINPAGQFLFIERDTDLPISDILVKHLISGKKTS